MQERLAMSLLYGCGLKPGEVCALRAEDIDTERHALRMRQPPSRLRPRVPAPVTARSPRSIPLPAEWSTWLCATAALSPPGAPVLSAGGGHGRSVRWLELVVRRAAVRADLVGGVSAMTLRHSYALHALEAGANVRAVQEALGHVRVETTLIYARLLSTKAISPLDRLPPRPNVTVEPNPPTNGALPTGDATPAVRPCLCRPGRNALPALAAALVRFWRTLRPAPS